MAGNLGCLATVASAESIRADLNAASLARRYATATGEDVGARGVQARLGSDPVADEVWGTAVRALAISLAQLTLGLDPQRFIIGGGLSKAGEVLLAPLRAELAGRLRWREIPDIVPAGLGETAGRWGALIAATHAAGSTCAQSWSDGRQGR